MNSKQRRKLGRKHKENIRMLRIVNRLEGGDGFNAFTNYEIARDQVFMKSMGLIQKVKFT